jgi:hypothetical protein
MEPRKAPPRLQAIGLISAIVLGYVYTSFAQQIENDTYRVSFTKLDGGVQVKVEDLAAKRNLADGPYYYYAVREGETDKAHTLENAAVSTESGKIVIRGSLAGLDVEQVLSLPPDRPVLEERIILRNGTPSSVALKEFEAGFTLRVTDAAGKILPELAGDRWAAVPFLRRAEDAKGVVYDFPLRVLLDQPGFEYIPHVNVFPLETKRVASPHRFSDGWAWMRGTRTGAKHRV